jgi:hypothetical protein
MKNTAFGILRFRAAATFSVSSSKPVKLALNFSDIKLISSPSPQQTSIKTLSLIRMRKTAYSAHTSEIP